MKLLVTSDIHIDSWDKFSSIDDKMIQSRLRDFLKLADLIHKKSLEEKVDAVVIAGDLANSGTNVPSVNDHIRMFLETLNNIGVPVLIINGNHDISTKSDNLVYYHSILKPLTSELCNIVLPSLPTVYNLKDFNILLMPWTLDPNLPKNLKADILVAHQVVEGSSNPEGYQFKSGFEKSYLESNFKFSILGHIHKFQLLDKKILIPGSPVQNSFKDQPENFIHIVEFNDTTKQFKDIKSIDVYKEIPNTFHRFLYTTKQDEIKSKSTNLIHYKLKNSYIESNQVDQNSEKVSTQRNNMRKFIEDFIVEDMKSLNLDSESLELRDKLLFSFLDNLRNDCSNIANIHLKNIYIENFLSIKELEFDFNNFGSKLITLIGKNGSGKTTLAESVLWVLTGELTKPIKVNDVSNTKLRDKRTKVELELTVNNKEYKIVRLRENKKPWLELQVLKDGQYVGLTTESVGMTQELIYKLLTLTSSEIRLFSYFSSDSALSFNSLNKFERTNIINKMFQISELDILRDLSKEELKKNTNEILEVDSSISTLQNLIDTENLKIKQFNSKYSESYLKDLDTKKKLLNSSINSITEDLQQRSPQGVDKKISQLESELREKQERQRKIDLEKSAIHSEITHLNKDLNSLILGVCPTCGHPYSSESHRLELSRKLESLTAEESLKTKESSKLGSDIESINSELSIIKTLTTKLNDFKSKLLALESSDESKELEKVKTSEEYIKTYTAERLKKEALKSDLLKLNVLVKYFANIFKRESKLVEKLNNLAITLIQGTVNDILKSIECPFECRVSPDSCEVKFQDEFRDYNTLSKGQQRLIDILFMVSLNLIFSRLNGLKNGIIGLTILDEVISFLDPEFTDYSLEIIDQLLSEHVILITHSQEVMSEVSNCIKVSLDSGFSEYKIINN